MICLSQEYPMKFRSVQYMFNLEQRFENSYSSKVQFDFLL